MHVIIFRADLHLPVAQSLKAKRSVVTPIIRHIDQMAGVAAAEVDFHDKWQRTAIGCSAVSDDIRHLDELFETIERYLWSRPGAEVLEITRSWWDEE